MTIRIPIRLLAVVVYTLALLGATFGISVAVSDWRDDDAIVTTTYTTTGISELEARQIAREEGDRAVQQAATLTLCLEVEAKTLAARGVIPTMEELRAVQEGCLERVGLGE